MVAALRTSSEQIAATTALVDAIAGTMRFTTPAVRVGGKGGMPCADARAADARCFAAGT